MLKGDEQDPWWNMILVNPAPTHRCVRFQGGNLGLFCAVGWVWGVGLIDDGVGAVGAMERVEEGTDIASRCLELDHNAKDDLLSTCDGDQNNCHIYSLV